MKYIFTLLLLCLGLNSFSQDSVFVEKENKSYEIQELNGDQFYVIKNDTIWLPICDKMPEFPGGEKELLKFISNNLKYPRESKKEGKVSVRFVVNTEGEVDSVEIIKGVSKDLDNEAARVIKNLPKWKPGTKKNKPVNVWYTLPINFRRY